MIYISVYTLIDFIQIIDSNQRVESHQIIDSNESNQIIDSNQIADSHMIYISMYDLCMRHYVKMFVGQFDLLMIYISMRSMRKTLC